MAGFGAAEVDAFVQADAGAVGPQAPAAAGREAQKDGFTVLLQAGFDGGVEVEADDEGLGVGGFDGVFAADVLAAFGHVDAAAVDGAEGDAPAVVAGVQPVGAVGFLARDLDVFRAAAEAFGAEFGGAGFGDDQGGVGGGGAAGLAPFGAGAGGGAAVDDEALAADRELERQGAGVGVAVELGHGGGAAVHDHDGAAGLQAVEAAFGQVRGHAAGAAGLGEDGFDAGGGVFARAVEQGEAAVAVAHQAQRGAHAFDGAD